MTTERGQAGLRGLGLKRGCEVICRQTVPALVTRIVALGTEVSRLSLIIHLRTVPTNKRYFLLAHDWSSGCLAQVVTKKFSVTMASR